MSCSATSPPLQINLEDVFLQSISVVVVVCKMMQLTSMTAQLVLQRPSAAG
jgi:hypothetical protein